MTIGERIKTLRKKNDLTQEKLADYLCVSYQAVSKWECGLASPDLSLVVPLAKILHVTTDELLGMNDEKSCERSAYLDERCEHYWLYDNIENYELAKQAVNEYPGNYKYLHWLASMEYFVAFEDKYRDDPKKPYSIDMIDNSIKHYCLVLEGTKDPNLRQSAIWSIMLAYKVTDRHDDALKYANMFPDNPPITRMQALAECLSGRNKDIAIQFIVYNALGELCRSFGGIYSFAKEKTPEVIAALDTEEGVLNAVFPDGKYGNFNHSMYYIYETRTKLEIHAGNLDKAIEYVQKACFYSKEISNLYGKIVTYTNPALALNSGEFPQNVYCIPFWEKVKEALLIQPIYAPLREREDFLELVNS